MDYTNVTIIVRSGQLFNRSFELESDMVIQRNGLSTFGCRGFSFRCFGIRGIGVSLFIVVLLFLLVLPEGCDACYAFPPNKKNPCLDKECHYGAYCVSSKDGSSARCQCADRCYDYGDSVGSKPVCGNDDRDYANFCELKRAACISMKIIKIKHYGKCGK